MEVFVAKSTQGWVRAGALDQGGPGEREQGMPKQIPKLWRRSVSRSPVPSHPGQATSDPSRSRSQASCLRQKQLHAPYGSLLFLTLAVVRLPRKSFVKWILNCDYWKEMWRRRESNPGPIILKCSFYTFSLQINFGKTYPTNGGLIPILLRVQSGSKRATNPKGP